MKPGRSVPLIVLGLLLVATVPATGHTPGPDTSAPPGFAGPAVDRGHGAAADDVAFTVTDITSDFGPETYKQGDRLNTRSPDDVENQTTTWETALGHRITVTVEVEPLDGDQIACDTRFVPEAFIATTAGRLYGYTPGQVGAPDASCQGVPGVRTFPLTFDLDGAAPTVTGSEFPALLPGAYSITFNLYYAVTPTASNPSGTGPLAGTTDVAFSLAAPRISVPQPAFRFPESTLRLFSDVGATLSSANEYAMMQRPLARDGNVTLTLDFPGVPIDARFEALDHYAVRTGPDLTPPGDVPGPLADPTPLDEAAEQLGDAEDRGTVTVQNVTLSLSLDQVPPSRSARMNLNATQFPTISGPTVATEYTPLQVLTIHVPASLESPVTGAATLVVPIQTGDFPVRDVETSATAPGVAETGTTRVQIRDSARISGGTSGRNAGDLFALRPLGLSHEPLAKARLTREDPTQPWVTGQFTHATFPADVGSYTLLAMLYGANDEFYGMNIASRGIGLEVGALRIVEGQSGDLLVTVTNMADDRDGTLGEADYAMAVTLNAIGFPNGEPYSRSIGPLVEGGSVVVTVPVDGTAPGTYNIVFTATAGELSAEDDTTVEVISTERAREENRKWYDLPAPGAVLVTLSLLAVVALMRRRD